MTFSKKRTAAGTTSTSSLTTNTNTTTNSTANTLTKKNKKSIVGEKSPSQNISLRRERLSYHREVRPHQMITSPPNHFPIIAILGDLNGGSPISLLDGTRSFTPFNQIIPLSTRLMAITLAPVLSSSSQAFNLLPPTSQTPKNLQHSEQWISEAERKSLSMPFLIMATLDGKVQQSSLTSMAIIEAPITLFECDAPVTFLLAGGDDLIISICDTEQQGSYSKIHIYNRQSQSSSIFTTTNKAKNVKFLGNELLLSCKDELFCYSMKDGIAKLKNSIKFSFEIEDITTSNDLIIVALQNETILKLDRNTLIQEEQSRIPLIKGLIQDYAWTNQTIIPIDKNLSSATIFSKKEILLINTIKIPINENVGRRSNDLKMWVEVMCFQSPCGSISLCDSNGALLELPQTTPIMNEFFYNSNGPLMVAQATYDSLIQRNKIGIWEFDVSISPLFENDERKLKSEIRLSRGTRILGISLLKNMLICNLALHSDERQVRVYSFKENDDDGLVMSVLPVKMVKLFSSCPSTEMTVFLDDSNVLHFYEGLKFCRKWDLRLGDGIGVLGIKMSFDRMAITTTNSLIYSWKLKEFIPKEQKITPLKGIPSLLWITSLGKKILCPCKDGEIVYISQKETNTYFPPSQGWKAFWQGSWNGSLLGMVELAENVLIVMNSRSLWKIVLKSDDSLYGVGKCLKFMDSCLRSSMLFKVVIDYDDHNDDHNSKEEMTSLFMLENPTLHHQQPMEERGRYGLN